MMAGEVYFNKTNAKYWMSLGFHSWGVQAFGVQRIDLGEKAR